MLKKMWRNWNLVLYWQGYTQCSHCGKQYGRSSKKLNIELLKMIKKFTIGYIYSKNLKARDSKYLYTNVQ